MGHITHPRISDAFLSESTAHIVPDINYLLNTTKPHK